jgi:hypothetical protein
MKISKFSFKIDETEVDTMFTAYLQRGAVKWIPLNIGFWTLSLIMHSVLAGFDAKMSVVIAELLISLTAYFVTKRSP